MVVVRHETKTFTLHFKELKFLANNFPKNPVVAFISKDLEFITPTVVDMVVRIFNVESTSLFFGMA